MAELTIDPTTIRKALDEFVESYKPSDTPTQEVGYVATAGDGIAHVTGLPGCMANELLTFEDGTLGLAFNLDAREIGVVILGDFAGIEEGQEVRRTGEVLSVPVGDGYLGRVVDPLGNPIDGLGEIKTEGRRILEAQAPDVMHRHPVDEPLSTGLKAIDAMTPIGRGQRQLIIGDLVAIIVVKQLFGGIGMNFANPALVGRIVLFISFAGSMNNWVFPDAAVDQLSSATPLAVADKSKLSLLDLFMGIHGGVLGETCALAIVLGLIYLVVTKTISIAIPAAYVGSMFVFYLIATHSVHAALVAVLSGGLMFGAVFMATDYVTSPFTLKGKLVYGVALGIVTFAIRYWGSYTEGVSFALLFMNLWVPYINDLTRQTPYGYVKPAKKEAAGK